MHFGPFRKRLMVENRQVWGVAPYSLNFLIKLDVMAFWESYDGQLSSSSNSMHSRPFWKHFRHGKSSDFASGRLNFLSFEISKYRFLKLLQFDIFTSGALIKKTDRLNFYFRSLKHNYKVSSLNLENVKGDIFWSLFFWALR